MTKDQVKEILDRVLTWTPERQSDAAEVLALMEAQDQSGYQLADEQAAEVSSPPCKEKSDLCTARRGALPFSTSQDMRVDVDDEALEDLRRIFEWISKDNPKAATRWSPAFLTRQSG